MNRSKFEQIIGCLEKNGLIAILDKNWFALSSSERGEIEGVRRRFKKRFTKRPWCSSGNNQTFLFFDYLQRHYKPLNNKEV